MNTEIIRAAGREVRFMVLATACAVAAFILGPIMEGALFPVLTDVELVDASRSGDMLRFRLDVTRHRSATCQFERQDWYRVYADGHSEHAFAGPVDGAPAGVTLPAGRVVGRLLEMRVADASEVRGVIVYHCGLPWATRSDVGPFPVPPG